MSTVIEMPNPGTFSDEVASRVRLGIAARNLRKADVAKAIGMNVASFSKRINGRLAIDLDEIHEIARATGISRNWLLTGTGPMFDPGSAPSRARTEDLRIKSPSRAPLVCVGSGLAA